MNLSFLTFTDWLAFFLVGIGLRTHPGEKKVRVCREEEEKEVEGEEEKRFWNIHFSVRPFPFLSFSFSLFSVSVSHTLLNVMLILLCLECFVIISEGSERNRAVPK